MLWGVLMAKIYTERLGLAQILVPGSWPQPPSGPVTLQ